MRTIVPAGAHRIDRITGLGGYGGAAGFCAGASCTAPTTVLKNPSTLAPQSSSPPGSCDLVDPVPRRTATRSRLGQTTTKLSPSPSAQNVSFGIPLYVPRWFEAQ